MSDTRTHTNEQIEQIARIIKQQIGIPAYMETGARNFLYGNFTLPGAEFKRPGLRFTCKPRHRLVAVYVVLDSSDTYTVCVMSTSKTAMAKELYRLEGVYADALPTVVRTLAKHV